MSLRRDLLYIICETLNSLFERHHDNLVKQVNKFFFRSLLFCKILNTTKNLINNFNGLSFFTFPYQALECDLLNEFLSILDSPLQEVESPSACKALIVKAVKAMQCSLIYGEQISAVLKDSQVCMVSYYSCNMIN